MSINKVCYVPDSWNGLLIVGDFPSKKKADSGFVKPLWGSEGTAIAEELRKVGIVFKECATMYAIDFYPKAGVINNEYSNKSAVKRGEGCEYGDRFISNRYAAEVDATRKRIDELKPQFILTLGEAGLFSVLIERGIDDFRGSMEWYESDVARIPVMPTHSISRVRKQPELGLLVHRDLARLCEHYGTGVWPDKDWNINIADTYDSAVAGLQQLLDGLDSKPGGYRMGVDIETRKKRFMSVIGFATSPTDALVIPFQDPDWKPIFSTVDEEYRVISLVRRVLEHPNMRLAGQNYHYDAQVLAARYGVRSNIWCDTMLAHHTAFNTGIKQALHVISSIYCEHYQYWKDESHADAGDDKWEPTWSNWENYLFYNGKDCCNTLECAEVLMDEVIPAYKLEKPWAHQMDLWRPLLKLILRGNKFNVQKRDQFRKDLRKRMDKLALFMEKIVPTDIYPRNPKTPFYKSPTQLKELFYTVLGQPVQTKKNAQGQWRPSTDDTCLKKVMQREEALIPLCQAILTYRQLETCMDTFLSTSPDEDGYMHSGYRQSGTNTYRFSSKKDAFDQGMNLQNINKGTDNAKCYMHRVYGFDCEIPNIKDLFEPDVGFEYCDVDLEQADAQIVAWESDCQRLKELFHDDTKDFHSENAFAFYEGIKGEPVGKYETVLDSGAVMVKAEDEWRKPLKAGGHATNYRTTAPTLANALSCTVADAQDFIDTWFKLNPEIKEWHHRTEAEVTGRGFVENGFGFRGRFLGRVTHNTLAEAQAWVPQSSVAHVINTGWCNIERTINKRTQGQYDVAWWEGEDIVRISFQVHDSLVMQFRQKHRKAVLPKIRQCMLVPIPYKDSNGNDDPLTIGLGSPEISKYSYGTIKPMLWEQPDDGKQEALSD
jgi:DNA polymerase I-like protein with 3'-5' exonuclease and polymerase domains/uracil-DNA glycosylase